MAIKLKKRQGHNSNRALPELASGNVLPWSTWVLQSLNFPPGHRGGIRNSWGGGQKHLPHNGKITHPKQGPITIKNTHVSSAASCNDKIYNLIQRDIDEQ